jgi:hypothetical protein
MLRSRPRPRRKTRTVAFCEDAIPSSGPAVGSPSKGSNPGIGRSGKSLKRLAPQDSHAHDSGVWHVTDDWPSTVPITADEVDVIEAFLRQAIDALLK